jgi:hypothetical protein
MIALFVLTAMLATPATAAPADETTPAEIGRVRANSAACLVSRDVVIPAFAAAMHADTTFKVAAPQFGLYAAAKAETHTLPTNIGAKTRMVANDPWSATNQMYLAKLDQALANITKDVLTISQALGDKRISADSTDPAVQAQREQLLKLEQIQKSRALALREFIMRESMGIGRDTGDSSALSTGMVDMNTVMEGTPSAVDLVTFGQPQLNGLAQNDKSSMNDWTASIERAVHANENPIAKTFFDIAKACHDAK